MNNDNFIVRSLDRLRTLFSSNVNTISPDENVLKKPSNALIIKGVYNQNELKSLYKKDLTDSNRLLGTGADLYTFLKDTSLNTNEVIKRNNGIANLIPEINPAKNVWVTCLLSPTDLQTNSVGFSLDVDYVSEEVRKDIEELYGNLFNGELKIDIKLAKYIGDCLFGAGSAPVLVLPKHNINMLRCAIDIKNIGQITTESIDRFDAEYNRLNETEYLSDKPILSILKKFNIGGSSLHIGLENLQKEFNKKDPNIYDYLTDNEFQSVLDTMGSVDSTEKLNFAKSLIKDVNNWFIKYNSHIVVSNNHSVITDRKESIDKILDDITNVLNVDSKKQAAKEYNEMFQSRHQMQTSTTTRSTVILSDRITDNKDDIPVILDIPPECVIPVCQPGFNDEHLGYFVLVEQWGTPMSKTLMTGFESRFSSNLVDMAVTAVYGTGGQNGQRDNRMNNLQKYNAAITVFDITISKLLENKLNDFGLHGMTVGRYQTISRCLFHHLLQEKDVGLIFVPKSLMTYFAFDYRSDGTGKSILEDIEFMLSMRSTLLVSKVLAMTRAAVEKTEIEIDMTNNLQALQTMNIFKSAYYTKNSLKLSNDPDMIVRNILDSRLRFKPKNLKGLEDYSINTNVESTPTIKPDDELLEHFDKFIYIAFGFPKSALEENENLERVASLASRNIFFANEVRSKQKILIPHIKKLTFTYVNHCRIFKDKILELLEKHYIIDDESGEDLDKDITKRIPVDKENPPEEIENIDSGDVESESEDEEDLQDTEESEDENLEVKPAIKQEGSKKIAVVKDDTYIKTISKDHDKKKGKTISSHKNKITQSQAKIIFDKIIRDITPTLPFPNISKGKAQYEEVSNYIKALDEIVDSLYRDDMISVDNEDIKAQYLASKSIIKASLIKKFISNIGKQDLFDIPELGDIDIKQVRENNQILLNFHKLLTDEIKQLSPTATESEY